LSESLIIICITFKTYQIIAAASLVKKVVGHKIAIFQQKLQIYDKIPKDNCKFSTEKNYK